MKRYPNGNNWYIVKYANVKGIHHETTGITPDYLYTHVYADNYASAVDNVCNQLDITEAAIVEIELIRI